MERAFFDGERKFDLVAAGGVGVMGGRCSIGNPALMGSQLEELQQPIFAHGDIRFVGSYIPRLANHRGKFSPFCCFATQTLKEAYGPYAGQISAISRTLEKNS